MEYLAITHRQRHAKSEHIERISAILSANFFLVNKEANQSKGRKSKYIEWFLRNFSQFLLKYFYWIHFCLYSP